MASIHSHTQLLRQAEKAAEQQRREAARQLQEQRAAASAAAAARAIPAHVALPEFYIVADAEPAPDEAVPTDRAGKRALELLQEYQSRQQARGVVQRGRRDAIDRNV